jgi:hypothetical protein
MPFKEEIIDGSVLPVMKIGLPIPTGCSRHPPVKPGPKPTKKKQIENDNIELLL